MPPLFLTQKGLSYDGPEFNAIANDLQGNILKSHGRNHTSNIFFRFYPGKANRAKRFIREFSHLVTSAAKQKADTLDFEKNNNQHLFTGLYLSGAGYEYLEIPVAQTPQDPQFRAGMEASKNNLGDVPSNWDEGYRDDFVHGMILLGFGGTERADILDWETMNIMNALRHDGLAHVFVERGDGIKNANDDDIEHFGYVDGISQPKFFQEELNPDLTTNWNPLASWDLVLEEDPGGTPGQSFGSYLVFRKLEQHVRDFKQAEQVLATALGLGDGIVNPKEKNDAREVAGAMIIGRFENGMPVTLSSADDKLNAHHDPAIPVSGKFVGKLNNFTYESDQDGARCPFHAHIRKSNPRGETTQFPGETIEKEQLHTMARRGIIYGHRDVHPNEQNDLSQLPNGGVGLLFMSFQRVLANQFEFIQQSWVNQDNFVFARENPPPALHTGKDPVIGQGAFDPLMHRYARKYDDATTVAVLADHLHTVPDPHSTLPAIADFGNFVTTRGGEYFFAPSKTFLSSL
ncbi:Dyp-type peroxidase [Spirosoma pollinicola]|uniref:Peroxidase n=1 Tax=Spirosoma pollinicola TaxID=2057025 RepID=A0A2K8Z1I4_9BACT|nr:peroxidase [Spirosoma pollinicola]AUD03711.1 peroxidase [Spirosoma pollinicola]